MSISLTGVQGWASQVQSAMTALPAELEQVAPSGSFANVLAQAAAALQGRSAPTTTAGPTSTTGGSLTRPSTATATGLTGPTWSVGGSAGQQVVADARRYLGTPYVWGGESPTGFDCSGLVQYVYRQVGVTLPRTTYTQVKVGAPVPSLTQAQPGDLVFFAGSDGTNTSPGHVGIYIGNGQMIDAPYTGAAVRVDPVGDPVAIRRVLPSTAASSGGAAAPSGAAAPGGPVGTGVPASLAPLFLSAAAKYGVPVRLLTAVAYHESRYEPHAVSSAGAEGIMQIMPGTAAGLGITAFTPAQAIDGAARLFSGYLQQFGSVPLALAAYDAGAGAVQQYGGVPPYAETQAYVQTIMQKLGGVA